ncbi:hypothetical protein [Methylobacterium nodulans]|uniref:hypothetical protein n=1 Tax=Methylobacterium nodulans TaxID=114616 RepID=UPI0012ECD1A1|nr:hypothetical protein [Methylobacterium nodulans]
MNESGSPLVAVVEVSLPNPKLEPVIPRSSGDVRVSRFQLVGPEPDPEEVNRRVNDVRRAIEEITGKPPENFLASSGSFVIEANGKQLLRVADLPNVAAIWPNKSQ